MILSVKDAEFNLLDKQIKTVKQNNTNTGACNVSN
jgi:hypothetical protein